MPLPEQPDKAEGNDGPEGMSRFRQLAENLFGVSKADLEAQERKEKAAKPKPGGLPSD